MESIAIAKSLAAKHKYEVDPGQELFALGVANMLGSITSAYPVTGSFSRSAVNNEVGAQTQLAGLVTGLLLLLTLLLLTPAFYFLPKFALAAIVIASVTNLIDYQEAIHLWHVKKRDCLLWVTAFLGTLFLGVQNGLMVAVGASLVMVIAESVRPQMSVLWRLPGTPIYRSIEQESRGQFVPGIVILRVGGAMFFANVTYIRDYVMQMVTEFTAAADATVGAAAPPADAEAAAAPDTSRRTRYVVLEMTSVGSVDSSAIAMLEDLHHDLKGRGIRLVLCNLGSRVEETLQLAGVIETVGDGWIHPTVHAATEHCMRHQLLQLADGGLDRSSSSSSDDSDYPMASPVANVRCLRTRYKASVNAVIAANRLSAILAKPQPAPADLALPPTFASSTLLAAPQP